MRRHNIRHCIHRVFGFLTFELRFGRGHFPDLPLERLVIWDVHGQGSELAIDIIERMSFLRLDDISLFAAFESELGRVSLSAGGG